MPSHLLFEPVCRSAQAPDDDRVAELIALAKSLARRGLTPSYGPGDHGNLSCRAPGGWLVSAAESRKASLDAGHVARVVGYDRSGPLARVLYDGLAVPSSDTAMHLEIYRRRQDVAAIVHAHDAALLAAAGEAGLPVTEVSAKTNSWALVDEVAALCRSHDLIVLRDHGVVVLGESLQAADARLQAAARPAR